MSAAKRDPSGGLDGQTEAGEEGRGAVARVHVSDPHASVPVRLMEADSGLTPAARLALIYLLDLGRRPNWTIYISYVVRRLGYGNRRWPRVRKEIEDAGFLTVRRGHDEAGDWSWSIDVYDRPLARPCIPAVCGNAECGDANRGDKRRSTSRLCTTRRSSSTRARARVVPPPEAAGAATAGEKKQRGPRRRNEVTCWTDDDGAWVEELTSEAGADAVRAAARAIRGLGEDPLPSVVEKRLRQDAAERARKEAERAAVRAEVAEAKAKAEAEAKREAGWNDPVRRAAAEQALAAIRERLK